VSTVERASAFRAPHYAPPPRRSVLVRWIPDDLPRAHLVGTIVTAAVVALCPLPFGSADNVWPLVWIIPLAAALPLFELRRVRRAHLWIVLPAIGLALATVLGVWMQTSPNASAVGPHPVWASASRLLGRPLDGAVSVDPAQSWNALARPLLLTLAFLCGFGACLDRAGARILFRAAAYAGLAYAIYGLVAHLVDPGSLLGVEKLAYVEDLTGTFVNRNTAATFFGSAMILWWARVVSELDARVPRSSAGARDWAAAILDSPPRALVLSGLGWFLVFAALMLTRSRAGVLLSLGALVATALLLLRHRLSARKGALVVVAGSLLLGAVVLELFAGAVAGRIGAQGLVDQGRLTAFASSLAIIGDFPLLGTGLGSFSDVFQAYRSGDMPTAGTWDRAHNTPLEIGVELGAPLAMAVVLLWIAGLWRLLDGSLRRRRDFVFPVSALGTGLLGSLHALVDFSPQIPGFAVMWLALLGGGIAQSVPSESDGKSAPDQTRDAAASLSSPGGAARPSRMALRATFAAVALGAAAFALQRLPAEIAADPVVSLASRIVNGLDFDPDALERYEPHIRRAEADESCGPLRAAVAAIRTYRVQQAASANDAARALENVRAGLQPPAEACLRAAGRALLVHVVHARGVSPGPGRNRFPAAPDVVQAGAERGSPDADALPDRDGGAPRREPGAARLYPRGIRASGTGRHPNGRRAHRGRRRAAPGDPGAAARPGRARPAGRHRAATRRGQRRGDDSGRSRPALKACQIRPGL
jgi:O-antigen ligase